MGTAIRAVLVDYDGTLTLGGPPRPEVLDALTATRRSGCQVVLVTGRIVGELVRELPAADELFDAIVAENGCVLRVGRSSRALVEPVDAVLDAQLEARGVRFRRGEVLVATGAEHTTEVAAAVGDLGLECHLVHNRAALMVLPAGASKGSGAEAALAALDVSARDALAIGDGENDHSLLRCCEIGVAVRNGVPALRAHADLVTDGSDGDGVVEVLQGGLVDGRRRVLGGRNRVALGVDDHDVPTVVPVRANVLVAGPSGSGKSYLAGLLAEGVLALGYRILVVDPEGDYRFLAELPGVLGVGGATSLPGADQLLDLLRRLPGGVVVDLTDRPDAEIDAFTTHVPAAVEAARSATGIPHWVLVDEAHGPFGQDGPAGRFFSGGRSGHCLVSYRPDALADDVLAGMDVVVLTAGGVLPDAARLAGEWPDAVRAGADQLHRGQVVVIARAGVTGDAPAATVTTVAPRLTPHVRHRHKYLTEHLDPGRAFHFRSGPDLATGAVATNLAELHHEIVAGDGSVLLHHAAGGDLSRWVEEVFADRELAGELREAERAACAGREALTADLRRALLRAVERRYLGGP